MIIFLITTLPLAIYRIVFQKQVITIPVDRSFFLR